MDAPHAVLSRRALLVGGAGLLALAACGGSDEEVDTTGASDDPRPDDAGRAADGTRFNLLSFFGGPVLVAGTEVRSPFGVGDAEGVPMGTDELPEELTFEVSLDGERVGPPVSVRRYGAEIPRPYYPLRFTPEEAGFYTVRTEVDGETLEGSLQVSSPGDVALPQPGDPMVPFETPTEADTRGVDPLCTRQPEPCPFHTTTLDEALAGGRPVAFLIATPAFCATAICGPVVDVLMARRAEFGDAVAMVHAEVYASGEQAAENPGRAMTAPVVDAYGLTFEPSMILAGADGAIAERLDFIFDAVELSEALARVRG